MKLPYKIYWPAESAAIAVMAACGAASLYFYRHFPTEVPTHWNAAGEIDGWSSAGFAAFFFPALIIGIYLMMLLLPLADPQKDRYREFGRPYQIVRIVLTLYLSAIYIVASLVGLGYDIPISRVMTVSIGLLFAVLGNFMPKLRKNWFVGIKTPWTLSSETVWNRTHRVGGKVFMVGGLLTVLSSFLRPEIAFATMMASVIAMSLGTIGYSWWVWREEKAKSSPPSAQMDGPEMPKDI